VGQAHSPANPQPIVGRRKRLPHISTGDSAQIRNGGAGFVDPLKPAGAFLARTGDAFKASEGFFEFDVTVTVRQ
jgi:hypothetical protein